MRRRGLDIADIHYLSRPCAGICFNTSPLEVGKLLPPNRSSTPATTIPEASSTTRYRPPGPTLPRLSICDKASARMSRSRFWSFLYQYSQTLNSVGSIVAKVLENLNNIISCQSFTALGRRDDRHLASFRFLYFSLLYSVLSAKFACCSICF
jgi:hypothetical protein